MKPNLLIMTLFMHENSWQPFFFSNDFKLLLLGYAHSCLSVLFQMNLSSFTLEHGVILGSRARIVGYYIC